MSVGTRVDSTNDSKTNWRLLTASFPSHKLSTSTALRLQCDDLFILNCTARLALQLGVGRFVAILLKRRSERFTLPDHSEYSTEVVAEYRPFAIRVRGCEEAHTGQWIIAPVPDPDD